MKMAIEIVDLPIDSMVMFHSDVHVYQRVNMHQRPFPLTMPSHGPKQLKGQITTVAADATFSLSVHQTSGPHSSPQKRQDPNGQNHGFKQRRRGQNGSDLPCSKMMSDSFNFGAAYGEKDVWPLHKWQKVRCEVNWYHCCNYIHWQYWTEHLFRV